jgi:hypothetical protein
MIWLSMRQFGNVDKYNPIFCKIMCSQEAIVSEQLQKQIFPPLNSDPGDPAILTPLQAPAEAAEESC